MNLDKKVILEAIDSLQARKVGVDNSRICQHLEQNSGLDRDESLTLLSSSIKSANVNQVKCKDYYIYKKPSTTRKLIKPANRNKAIEMDEVNQEMPLSLKRIIQAIKRLNKSSHRNSGASANQILNLLHSNKHLLKYDINLLEKTLHSELNKGKVLVKLIHDSLFYTNSNFFHFLKALLSFFRMATMLSTAID